MFSLFSGSLDAVQTNDGTFYAYFNCNLKGRFVTLQRYQLNTYSYQPANVMITAYNSFGINEVTFYAVLN